MFRMFYLRLLLALGFVLGQSFALAHATQHELDSAGKVLSCEICAVAHAGGGLPGSAPSLPPIEFNTATPDCSLPAVIPECFTFRPLSRGPPSILS